MREIGHLHIKTLRNIFTFTKRCVSSNFSQNLRHRQSNLHFPKWIRNMHWAKVCILLNGISAIMTYANAIKPQSLGKHNWKGKVSNSRWLLPRRNADLFLRFKGKLKICTALGNFPTFKVWDDFFFGQMMDKVKHNCMLGFVYCLERHIRQCNSSLNKTYTFTSFYLCSCCSFCIVCFSQYFFNQWTPSPPLLNIPK